MAQKIKPAYFIKVVKEIYSDEISSSFQEALKVASYEGIEDLSCAVFRLSFHLDYAQVIDYNRKRLSI